MKTNKYKNQSSLIKYIEQCNITAGETSLFIPPPPFPPSNMLKYLSGKYTTIFDHNKTRKLKYSSMFTLLLDIFIHYTEELFDHIIYLVCTLYTCITGNLCSVYHKWCISEILFSLLLDSNHANNCWHTFKFRS